jgi:uncharacterized protein YukE
MERSAAEELAAAMAEYSYELQPLAKKVLATGAELDRLATSCERCARAFLECAKNLRNNADEARANLRP